MKSLNTKTTEKPTYPERIVQFGAGNFLRGFADWMIDILNEEANFNSSVVIVKATPRGSYATLDEQDCLYHTCLYSMHEGELKTQTRLIKCISRTINPYNDYDNYLALAKQAELRFVISNTTESGISFDETDTFDTAPTSSFPAKLTRFLFERFDHYNGAQDKGLIVLPCELIEDNGSELKRIILDYAQLWNLDANFSIWIQENNIFCNTLVDRIVTGFPKETIESSWKELGFKDELLVEGEAYHSWIIEGSDSVQDSFPTNKTELNVQFTTDLSIQREIKVRILNGTHTAMVPVGYLYGARTVDAVVADKHLRTFVEELLFQEVTPTLSSPEEELKSFAKSTLVRFQNPTLQHHLSAIALNSTSKFYTRLLPSLIGYYEKTETLPKRIVFAFACLIRFYKGEWQEQTTPVSDETEVLKWWANLWSGNLSTLELVNTVLANNALWGQDLRNIQGLGKLLESYLNSLENKDIVVILKYLEKA